MDITIESEIISTLDALVADGIIISGPYETIDLTDEGYPAKLRVCPALLKKPHTVGAALNSAFDKGRKWGPGSDMFVPDERLIVAQLNKTHDLALNLFCVDRPQLLLPTLDSYKRQDQPLDSDDLAAALELLRCVPDMYVIYNGGEAAGCSRMHKHMQGLRGPPPAFDALTKPDINTAPFQYFAQRLDPGFESTSASALTDAYINLLDKARIALRVEGNNVCPHNVVMWADWIIVIPRRRGSWGGVSANAAGMVGSMWVTKKDQADDWLRLGPATVLRELGVPV